MILTKVLIDTNICLNAIHYQAALAAGCDAVITRNKKDFKEADLSVLSPVEFLDQLDQQ